MYYIPYIKYLEKKKKNTRNVSKEVCSKEFLNMMECYRNINICKDILCKNEYTLYLSCLKNARTE